MGRPSQVVTAAVVAVCLLAVFISPLVATPLTTLRGHAGLSALHGIASAGLVFSQPAARFSDAPERRQAWRPSGAELIDLTCVRLC